MKKIFTLSLLICVSLWAKSANDSIPFANTIAIYPGDTEEIIRAKAAHVVPNERQINRLDNPFIAFIHFGPNTFTGREWGTGFEDPEIFNPTDIDADQWVKTMKDAGIDMVIFTVKHHEGYVLYQTRYTDHGIMKSPYMNGQADVFRALSDACAKYGMKLGVYLSPADLYQIESPNGLYGNGSEKRMRTIPKEVPGRPFENPTKFEFMVDDYNEFFMSQLFELLTEYGPIYEVWFDGANPKENGQTYNNHDWETLVRTLAPEAIVFPFKDGRWVGNEAGDTRDTEWNVVPYATHPDSLLGFGHPKDTDIGSMEKLKNANYLQYQYPEVDTSIRDGWMWRDDDKQAVRSADEVFDIYERSVGGNAVLLLNIPPNTDGKFSDRDVASLSEVGKRIRETYTDNLIEGWNAPAVLFDDDTKTGIPVESELVISSDKPATFNRLLLQEEVPNFGERIEKLAVDAWVNGEWKQIVESTNVGYRRILRFPEVTTDKIRIRILESRLTPSLATVKAHYYKTRPPQLQISRNLDGEVSIYPKKSDFTWKNGNKDALKNLTLGTVIHYTTDGTTPTLDSPVYTEPFKFEDGTVKAISSMNGETGPVVTQVFGKIKKDWKVVDPQAGEERFAPAKAIDAEPSTYWKSDSTDLSLTLDLGKENQLHGFVYTPQTAIYGEGMIEKGDIEISDNGKDWKKVGTFEFGNLINDPTPRTFEFDNRVSGRFVRIVPITIAGNGNIAMIAEIDFL
ncbi:MAG: alpha-L-fucosidase [Muribaculaceae bacterium]|nr:alpha-L-fucosidase [Muribaculaceae bacterium]